VHAVLWLPLLRWGRATGSAQARTVLAVQQLRLPCCQREYSWSVISLHENGAERLREAEILAMHVELSCPGLICRLPVVVQALQQRGVTLLLAFMLQPEFHDWLRLPPQATAFDADKPLATCSSFREENARIAAKPVQKQNPLVWPNFPLRRLSSSVRTSTVT
jgi:hypothetical protein